MHDIDERSNGGLVDNHYVSQHFNSKIEARAHIKLLCSCHLVSMRVALFVCLVYFTLGCTLSFCLAMGNWLGAGIILVCLLCHIIRDIVYHFPPFSCSFSMEEYEKFELPYKKTFECVSIMLGVGLAVSPFISPEHTPIGFLHCAVCVVIGCVIICGHGYALVKNNSKYYMFT